MRSPCGSTLTTRSGTTPWRRQAPSAPSTATTAPPNREDFRRSRLRRRWRLGPAAITRAASPSPTVVPVRSRIERRMRGRFSSALARASGAIRSNVAWSSWLAIRRPRSIGTVTLPEEALLADEADAAAEPRERLALEGLGGVRGVLGRLLDRHVQRVVAAQVLLHALLPPPARSASLAAGTRRSTSRPPNGGIRVVMGRGVTSSYDSAGRPREAGAGWRSGRRYSPIT